MAEPETQTEPVVKKRSKRPLLVGVILALLAGGGGFYAMYSGMLDSFGHGESPRAQTDHAAPSQSRDIAFVPIDPLIISLGPGAANRHLRFSAQLEVNAAYEHDVALLLPRVMDVLNGYLRAVAMSDLEDPTALLRLRAQMLRRIQLVTGEGRVRDLLITEFVLS